MPNLCNYSMKVTGAPENVEKFINIIQVNYMYKEDGTCINPNTGEMVDRHFWRVFEAYIEDDEIENNIRSVIIGGDCAWSVHSCMCSGLGTYQSNSPNRKGTTLRDESERLSLTIEVFSEECGFCFMEHMVYVNGKQIINDCIDWNEYYTGEYETVEEMNEECDTYFTQEEFENNEYLSIGGIDWCFDEWEYKEITWEDDI